MSQAWVDTVYDTPSLSQIKDTRKRLQSPRRTSLARKGSPRRTSPRRASRASPRRSRQRRLPLTLPEQMKSPPRYDPVSGSPFVVMPRRRAPQPLPSSPDTVPPTPVVPYPHASPSTPVQKRDYMEQYNLLGEVIGTYTPVKRVDFEEK